MDPNPPVMDYRSLTQDSDDEWVDDEGEELMPSEPTRCLFCEQNLPDPTAALMHCRDVHQFNITTLQKQLHLDCFGYIKMINFCRAKTPSVDDLVAASSNGPLPWEGDEYMKPVLEDDPLLTFDIEDFDIPEVETDTSDGTTTQKTVNSAEQKALLEKLKTVEARAQTAEEQLEHLAGDLNKMRQLAQTLVMAAAPEPVPSHQAIASLQEDDDDLYFGSYAHFSIHQDMLQDKVRTESYRDSIYKNKELFAGKVVLDIGCGTGILSMFAAKAGAKKVIGVDMSEIAYQAIDIVSENNLSDVITIIKGRVEDIDLPVEQVDIIISEWMGYFLLFESMLDTVLYARDRWLAPGGVILPNRCNISLVGLADAELRNKHLAYWQDVYGFRMSCMRKAVVQEASVAIVNNDRVVTDASELTMIDISTCKTSDLEFTSPFKLMSQKDEELTALVAYFDIWFDSFPEKVHFSTGPAATPTHWKQTVFLLDDPISLKKGETLEGQLICRKNRKDPRSLRIIISIAGKSITYHMQ